MLLESPFQLDQKYKLAQHRAEAFQTPCPEAMKQNLESLDLNNSSSHIFHI